MLHDNTGPFNIASGAILGIGAGFLWTAQGCLMLAYPTENNKGKFIAIFWSIFNLGGVVGATVSLGQNYGSNVSARRESTPGYPVEHLDFREIRVRAYLARRMESGACY